MRRHSLREVRTTAIPATATTGRATMLLSCSILTAITSRRFGTTTANPRDVHHPVAGRQYGLPSASKETRARHLPGGRSGDLPHQRTEIRGVGGAAGACPEEL